MPRTIISVLVILLLGGALVMLALRGSESPSTEPDEPIQYPDQEETTVAPSEPTVQYSSESIQYHSELPNTGGVELW